MNTNLTNAEVVQLIHGVVDDVLAEKVLELYVQQRLITKGNLITEEVDSVIVNLTELSNQND